MNKTAAGAASYLFIYLFIYLFFHCFQNNDFRRVDDEYICQVADSEYRNIYINETLCAVWYHFYNLKTVKNTDVGLLLLVKLQDATLLKVTLQQYFSRVLNCTNGTEPRKASHQMPG